jgi:hypothetical protein
MPDLTDVSRSDRSREDAITAAWLEDGGPYVTLSSKPEDEKPEADRNLLPTRVE